MFAGIRRHQKWLWMVIIVLVIISFVVYLDPTYSGGRQGASLPQQTEFGSIYGRPLTREEVMEAGREARLQFRLLAGRWPEEDAGSRAMFNPDRLVPQRLLMIEQMRRMNVVVPEAAVADWIAEVFQDRQGGGGFDMDFYRQMLQRELAPQGYREEDLRRYAQHEVGFQYLIKLLGLTGEFVPPAEAEATYRLQNEQITAEAVVFAASNHLAGVQVTDAALDAFFATDQSRYRVPEKVQVSYVRFASTNHFGEADALMAQRTNLTAQLQAEYLRRGPDFFKDGEGKTLSEEAALQKIREELRTGLAMVEARKRAMAFAEELYALYEKEPKQLDNLENLAAAKGLVAAVTEPFTRFEPPSALNVLDTFPEVAFQLNAEQPMATEPVLSADSVFILAFKQRVPSELPPLASVRERVVADYRQQQATSTAQQEGRSFQAAVVAGEGQNKSFEAVAAEQKLSVLKLPPFALSATSLPGWESRIDFTLLRQAASTLQAGKVSEFLSSRQGGLVVRVAKREPADEARLKAELPAFLERIRRERRGMAFNEWLRRELDVARITGFSEDGRSRGAEAP